jgi:activator of HSP90 ATPase
MGSDLARRDIPFLALATLVGVPVAAQTAVGATTDVLANAAGEISHSNAAIHQEVDFTANPARLYRALLTTEEFDKIVQLSAAMNSGMKAKLGSVPTMIDPRPVGAFVLFGGYITGRTLDLVPDYRIVQAWRAGSWNAGDHSIVRFELVARRAGTRLIFDHVGFPNDAAAELAHGWHVNYWEPLAKVLA